MMALRVRKTIPRDARLFVTEVFEDERGFFKEMYTIAKYRALGLMGDFVQDSVSFSAKNVFRGLYGDCAMSTLVHVLPTRSVT
jgi:dTDP-4-dehydrorhamnose 3,5-epimerase-like enzyme